MERRQHPRVATNQQATVLVLDGQGQRLLAVVLNYSGAGMQLSVDQPIAVSSPLLVELPGLSFVGESCYITPGPPYRVGVVLEQVLYGGTSVRNLAEATASPSKVTQDASTGTNRVW